MPSKTPPPDLLFYLDASAIVNGANLPPGRCRTSPAILDEFREGGATRRRLDHLLAAGMRVDTPVAGDVKRVETAAAISGAAPRLSRADREILALALSGGAAGQLLTDDYTLQDLARRLGVNVASVSTDGAGEAVDWGARCTGCGRRFDQMPKGEECPVCGSRVRLKPKRPRSSRAGGGTPSRGANESRDPGAGPATGHA